MNKIVSYIVIDIIILSGIPMSLYVAKDNDFIPIFIVALIFNLLHQIYSNKENYKKILDTPGRAFSIIKIKWIYNLFRWFFTFAAFSFILIILLDFFNII